MYYAAMPLIGTDDFEYIPIYAWTRDEAWNIFLENYAPYGARFSTRNR